MTNEEHKIALVEIERLMESDPSKDSAEGMLLAQLAEKVQKHETAVYAERLDIWSRIAKEPLFQFLKHDPVGRTILCLFANDQISHGKCAEAIAEKFCLGLEPTLPEWKGYDGKE